MMYKTKDRKKPAPMRAPVLFWSDASREALREAKEYIRRFDLTKGDVSLVQRDGQTMVLAKRDVRSKLVDK